MHKKGLVVAGLAGGVLFVLSGVAGAAITREPVAAECAGWECEMHMFCEENPGEETFCDRPDNSNDCTTKGGCAEE